MKDFLAVIPGAGRGTRRCLLTEPETPMKSDSDGQVVVLQSRNRHWINNRNFFFAVFFAFTLFHFVLLANQRLYPFIDLPFHLSAATIVKHYDEIPAFRKYYQADFSMKANIFHLLFCLNPLFPNIEVANRAFYLLYVFLLPLSVLLVIRAVGGTIWFSLLSFILLYNFNVTWGFTGFTIGIPAFFLLFTLVVQSSKKPSLVLDTSTAGLLVVLFLMHAIIAAIALGIYCIAMVFPLNTRMTRYTRRCLVMVPVASLLLHWWFHRPPTSFKSWELIKKYYQVEFFSTYSERFLLLYADNYSLFAGLPGKIAGFLGVLFIVTPLVYALVSQKSVFYRLWHDPMSKVVTLSACFFLFLCLLLPHGIEALCWYLYPRFSVFFLLFCIILGSMVFKTKTTPAAIIIICSVITLFSLLWADYFRTFDRKTESFNLTLMPADPSARLAGIMYDFRYRDRPAYIHFPNYHIVWNRGIATTRLVEFRFLAVRRKTDFTALPMYLEWITADTPYDGRYSHLEYILVRGTIPGEDRHEFKDFDRIKRSHKWTLFKKRTTIKQPETGLIDEGEFYELNKKGVRTK